MSTRKLHNFTFISFTEREVNMLTRRDFLKLSVAAGAAMVLSSKFGKLEAFAAAGTPNIAKFTNRLVHPIPKLTPDTIKIEGADYYELTMSAGTH